MFLALARAPRSADVKEEKERIMMFVSMVNSRFYVPCFHSLCACKIAIAKIVIISHYWSWRGSLVVDSMMIRGIGS